MSSVRMGRRRASDVDMADGRYALERLLEPRRWKRRRIEADPKQISRRTPHVVCRRRRPADPAIEFGKPPSYRPLLARLQLADQNSYIARAPFRYALRTSRLPMGAGAGARHRNSSQRRARQRQYGISSRSLAEGAMRFAIGTKE